MIWHEYCALKSEIGLHQLPVTLWQLPLRDFAVLTRRSRSVREEINPWCVAEEGEMRSLVSALKPGIGSSWTWREEWSYMVASSLPVCSHLKANNRASCSSAELLLGRNQVAIQDNNLNKKKIKKKHGHSFTWKYIIIPQSLTPGFTAPEKYTAMLNSKGMLLIGSAERFSIFQFVAFYFRDISHQPCFRANGRLFPATSIRS